MNLSTKSRLTVKQLSWLPGNTLFEKIARSVCRVAVLPCCHDLERCDTGGLSGWMDGPTCVDATRAARLRAGGYRILTRCIPADISPRNRLLMGCPEKG